MKRILTSVVLLSVLIYPVPAAEIPTQPAITTWAGLKFGMTRQQVKAVLATKYQLTDTEECLIADPIKIGATTGKALFYFDCDNRKGLGLVRLRVAGKDGPIDEVLSSEERTRRILMLPSVGPALLEKYGHPVDETGYCPTQDEIIDYFVRLPFFVSKCTRTWKSSGQVITLDFHMAGVSVLLTVEYKPSPGSEI